MSRSRAFGDLLLVAERSLATVLVASSPGLAERKGIGGAAGVEELDVKGPVRDRTRLSHELVQAGFLDAAPSVRIDIQAVIGPRRRAVDRDAKANGLRRVGRAHDEVHIARMKPVRDPASCRIKRR